MFACKWLPIAADFYNTLREQAEKNYQSRQKNNKTKSSRIEGLYKQLKKTLELLKLNPRHPGLKTHAYDSLQHPYHGEDKVFEAYVQNNTPGAYRVFWCYGPGKHEITIIAITPHP